tara:strand:+ start:139 stop:561 length:423 start_codon:yes stop_codon:yes gene_type:complete
MTKKTEDFHFKNIEIENTQVYNNTGNRLVGLEKLVYLFKLHFPTVLAILILTTIIGIMNIYNPPTLSKMYGGAGVIGAKTIGRYSKVSNIFAPLKPLFKSFSSVIMTFAIIMLLPAAPILLILLVLFHYSGRFFYNLKQL